MLLGWLLIVVVLRSWAPAWSDIAADGDLAFLPKSVPSSVGQQRLVEAFPNQRGRSQMVMIVASPEQELGLGDLALAMDIARQLHWIAAQNAWRNLQHNASLPAELSTLVAQQPLAAETIVDNLTEAIEIEEILIRYLQSAAPDNVFLRLPDAYEVRGKLLTALGDDSQQALAALDLDTAALMHEQHTPTLPNELPLWGESVQDVWSWRHPVVGHKLGSAEPKARLLSLQLGSDFTAVGNIATLNGLEHLTAQLRSQYQPLLQPELQLELSGSAAVGADMLRAAASGVRLTEIVTVGLVLLILTVVYRAPFLVAIPLTSIAVSLMVATSVIALLARDPADASGWGLGVFTTTRIFIVVILFGAGTDFCLFFLARSRELLEARPPRNRREMQRAVARSWCSVHDALLASALTTIVGLALMWFSDFQKFQYSGPIIAISLLVTLGVCLTFTPALLCAVGWWAFWPNAVLASPSTGSTATGFTSTGLTATEQTTASQPTSTAQPQPLTRSQRYWAWLASGVVGHPLLALSITFGLLAAPAVYGVLRLGNVTYDLTEELSSSAPSRRGARLISQFFPTQDGSPLTLLLVRDQPFTSEDELREACQQLSTALYVEGVDAVRSLTDPLGDYPPGKRMGLFDKNAWRRRVLNRIARERYVSTVDDLHRRVARFDVVLTDNPFSLPAGETLKRIRERLAEEVGQDNSAWHDAQWSTTGTTVGIADLRQVTQADQRRIRVLVTIGVWLVLVILLRQWVLSTYLIFTVLLSYFATLGITYATFATLYGSDYSGLDWKVPLFLFVILVAVGQDYNVYLVTRILQERRLQCSSTLRRREGRGSSTLRRRVGRGGSTLRRRTSLLPNSSVQRALEKTGGIITSCGFVMAGTFVAMTSPAVLLWLGEALPAGWVAHDLPVLRGITELGFALALGVLLDTLIVRSILVPAFVVLWQPEPAEGPQPPA